MELPEKKRCFHEWEGNNKLEKRCKNLGVGSKFKAPEG
jgi:hypothetical protein